MTDERVIAELRRVTAQFQLRAIALHMGADPNAISTNADGPSLTIVLPGTRKETNDDKPMMDVGGDRPMSKVVTPEDLAWDWLSHRKEAPDGMDFEDNEIVGAFIAGHAAALDAMPRPDDALQAENARLRNALEPFANAADELDHAHRDDRSLYESSVTLDLTGGNLRDARAALASGEAL